jgi:hypothetical protein
VLLRIEHLDVLVLLNRCGCNRSALIGSKNEPLGLIRVHGQADLFQVENDIRHIFLNSGNGRILVRDPLYTDGHYRGSLKGGEENATKSVSESDTEAPLQGLALELAICLI